MYTMCKNTWYVYYKYTLFCIYSTQYMPDMYSIYAWYVLNLCSINSILTSELWINYNNYNYDDYYN